MNTENLLDRAISAYQRHCDKNGCVYRQPNATLSTVSANGVVLANINGVLAQYNLTATGRLRRVEPSA